jgi:magnesium-transporting ATPase (P-type)
LGTRKTTDAAAHTADEHRTRTKMDVQQRAEPREQIDLLFRDLRSRPSGLESREAERRLTEYGSNGSRRWPRELARQFTHPLALLLWGASILAFFAASVVLGVAIALVVVLNAAFAFVQERHAERAV